MVLLNRLWVRLTLAFLLTAWVAIGLVALIMGRATEANFQRYINTQNSARFSARLLTNLADYYAANETWSGAETVLDSTGQGQGQGQQGGETANERRGIQILIADPAGQIMAATDTTFIGQSLSNAARDNALAIEDNNIVVGLLAQESRGMQALGEAEAAFLAQMKTWLVAAVLITGILAVLTGAVLARQLARPLMHITTAVHDLSTGELGRQVTVAGSTEIIALAHGFNTMSDALAKSEQLRQHMASDVAHELRTPVSVLRGHLEAMLDGVFPLDDEHLAVAYDQTLHMTRLVDDLRLLTQAEAGRLPLEKVPTMPATLVNKALAFFQPLALDAEITLQAEIAPALPAVLVDVDRLQQVLGNLLSNALRHTPPGGQISIHVTKGKANVNFAVKNTGQGLSAEDTARLFERFWRAEEARERDSGGSGLGLAITRELIRLHDGSIQVESTANTVTVSFTLPEAA